jgi:hypothetical protein
MLGRRRLRSRQSRAVSVPCDAQKSDLPIFSEGSAGRLRRGFRTAWEQSLLDTSLLSDEHRTERKTHAVQEHHLLRDAARTPAALSAAWCGARGRQSLPLEAARTLPGIPREAQACDERNALDAGVAVAMVRLAPNSVCRATGDISAVAAPTVSPALALALGFWTAPIPRELQALIRQMARDNCPWGQQRIANELRLKLGIQVSPRTVRKYIPT